MAFNATRVASTFDKEILKYWTGTELAKNVVLDSSNLASYATQADGRVVVVAGTVLQKSGADVDEVQKIHIKGVPTGGTFKLSFNDEVTAAINWNDASAAVATALQNLTNLEAADVAVTGTNPDFTVTFGGAYSGKDVSQIKVALNSLTGGTDARVEIETTTIALGEKVKPAAVSGLSNGDVVGILAYTVEFFDTGAVKFDEPAAAFFRGCIFDQQKLIAYSANAAVVKNDLPQCSFL